MEKSEKVPEPKLFSATNKSENSLGLLTPAVTVNQTFYVNPQHDRLTTSCCMDAGYFCQKTPCRVAQVNREFNPPAHAAKHAGLMWYSEPEGGAATPARMDLSPDCRCPHPAQSSGDDTRGECNCWKCGRHKCGSTGPANRSAAREEDEYNSQLQSLEEDLEPPLPLRSDDEWQYDSPFVPPHVYMHPHNIHHAMDVRCYHSAGEGHYNFNPVNRYPPQSFHYSAPSQNWLQCHHNCMNGSLSQGGVSVNVPQFSVPPAEGMSQVSVMNLNSAGAEASFSHPHEKIKTISLPDVCRNVFITYSSDASSEIVPFVDFLTKQGFRTAIDIFDSPVRCMDINKWNDSHLKDPSTLIIIAISPKYKADIEGSVEDSHGLHTRYIHTMMQNEFIQQGSLNFRFIPVLFLRSSQKHVPSWLQNSRFYRWPQDTEDLLLRLLREERYVPPPVPMELTLIIRPVDPSCAASL